MYKTHTHTYIHYKYIYFITYKHTLVLKKILNSQKNIKVIIFYSMPYTHIPGIRNIL